MFLKQVFRIVDVHGGRGIHLEYKHIYVRVNEVFSVFTVTYFFRFVSVFFSFCQLDLSSGGGPPGHGGVPQGLAEDVPHAGRPAALREVRLVRGGWAGPRLSGKGGSTLPPGRRGGRLPPHPLPTGNVL